MSIPFINTRTITDVGILFLLLPVWWVLGIEQLIWPLGLGWIAGKMLLRRRSFKVLPTTKWLLLFLYVYAISGLNVDESYRWITFIRTFSTYITAFFLVFILTNEVRSWRDIQFLIYCVILTLFSASLIGLIGILGIWRPTIPSAMSYIIPEGIKYTEYGSNIAYRSTGHESWFFGLGEYFRVKSIFMFSTMYASTIAIVLPFALYALHHLARGFERKIVWFLVVAALWVNLIYTTGRMAIAGFVVGGLIYLVWFSRLRWWLLLFGGMVICSLGIWLAFGEVAVHFLDDSGGGIIDRLIYARGAGSALERSEVYFATLEGILERPLLGWGTERDIVGLIYPAGSHSYYLGVLYKHGVLGLFVFLRVLWSLWRDTQPPKQEIIEEMPERKIIVKFIQYGRWSIIASLINGLTDALDLDGSTMAIMWLIWSLLISARILDKTHLTGIYRKTERE